jgi:hypothetical protein
MAARSTGYANPDIEVPWHVSKQSSHLPYAARHAAVNSAAKTSSGHVDRICCRGSRVADAGGGWTSDEIVLHACHEMILFGLLPEADNFRLSDSCTIPRLRRDGILKLADIDGMASGVYGVIAKGCRARGALNTALGLDHDAALPHNLRFKHCF